MKILFCTYLLTLGCQRLTFGLSNGVTTSSWLILVLTHLVEMLMWWSFALSPSFRHDLTFTDLIQTVIQLEAKGGFKTAILLIGVPLMVGRFILTGGPSKTKSKK